MLTLSNRNFPQNTPARYSGSSNRAAQLKDTEIDTLFSSFWLRQLLYQIPDYKKVTTEEVRDLDLTVQALDAEGRFVQQPELKQILDGYVQMSHMSAVKWTSFEALKKKVSEAAEKEAPPVTTTMVENATTTVIYVNKTDIQDLQGTYEVVRAAVAASGTRRRRDLVHLLDAQRAVNTALAAATKPNDKQHFNFLGGYINRYYRRSTYGKPVDLDLTANEDEVTFQYSLDLSNMTKTL